MVRARSVVKFVSAGADGVSKSENAMAVHSSITEAIPKENEMAQKFVQRNEVDRDTMVPLTGSVLKGGRLSGWEVSGCGKGLNMGEVPKHRI